MASLAARSWSSSCALVATTRTVHNDCFQIKYIFSCQHSVAASFRGRLSATHMLARAFSHHPDHSHDALRSLSHPILTHSTR